MKRSRILPSGSLRGRFAIAEGALVAAERLLPTFRGPDGDHEGLLFLLGLEFGDRTLFTSVLAPECEHGPGFVRASPGQSAAAARAARSLGLGVLGQIHSHPREWSEHSEGDDELVLMPFETMISLVVPHYARYGLRPISNLGVHQYQDGRWTLITEGAEGIRIVADTLDLRR